MTIHTRLHPRLWESVMSTRRKTPKDPKDTFQSPEFNTIEHAGQQVKEIPFGPRPPAPAAVVEETQQWKSVKEKVMIVSLSGIIIAAGIAVTVYESLLLSENNYQFPFPIFSAAVTNVFLLVLSAACVAIYGRLFRTIRVLFTPEGWQAIYKAILPCSIVTALEVAITLISLQFVTVSFFTMVRSSSIIFILLGAFMFGREAVSLTLLSVILLTGVGVTLAAYDPKTAGGWNSFGFSLVLLASAICGVKWVLTEMLLNENEYFKAILKDINASSRPDGKTRNLTPVVTNLLLSPITLLILTVATVLIEGFPRSLIQFAEFNSLQYGLVVSGSLVFISVLVFIMRVLDFRLVQMISLVTFSLLGVVKEFIMIMISVVFLGETLVTLNWLGMIITMLAMGLYAYYRHNQSKLVTEEIELQPVPNRRRKPSDNRVQ